jgi:hypothetical protein
MDADSATRAIAPTVPMPADHAAAGKASAALAIPRASQDRVFNMQRIVRKSAVM